MKDKNMYLRKKKAENLNNILICENCGEQQISVCDSRMLAGTRRRRRICTVCGHKSTTYEISNEEFERLLNEGENQKAKYNHGYTKGHSDGYAKAIDEFAGNMKDKSSDILFWLMKRQEEGYGTSNGELHNKWLSKIDKIAEQMKGEQL